MVFRQCEMCDHCKVKLNSDMSLDVSCYLNEYNFIEKFENKRKCKKFKPVELHDFYPLIFTKINLKGR